MCNPDEADDPEARPVANGRHDVFRAPIEFSAPSEITYVLGFSEPSNFSRAFKCWTGASPSEYRESL